MRLLQFCCTILSASLILALFSCNHADKPDTFAATPDELQEKTVTVIKSYIETLLADTASAIDSVVRIYQPER
ncbi:MAG: hypothetical protein IPM85_04165 [Chitinophagaceae bacterium]|nr:hypothetical protein [Chitinophagaceae bacterium]